MITQSHILDGVYKLEDTLFSEYKLLWGSYAPRFNVSWVSVHLLDESVAESLMLKYDMRKGFKHRLSTLKK